MTNIVITLGAKGAFYANRDGSGHCPAFDVKIKDATDTGYVLHHDRPITCSNHYRRDTFTGAYASEYVQQKSVGNWDIRSAVIMAKKAAAIMTHRVVAQNGIPWVYEIDNSDACEKIPHAIRSDLTAF